MQETTDSNQPIILIYDNADALKYESCCIVIEIDGAEISNQMELHDCLHSPLKFPGNYGHSLEALYEVLIDLAWLNGKPVHLIITNFDYFLDEETTEKKIQLMMMLVDTAEEWQKLTHQSNLFQISVQQSNSIEELLITCEIAYTKL